MLEARLKADRPHQYAWYLRNRVLVSGGKQEIVDYKSELDRLVLALDAIRPRTSIRSNYFRYTETEEKQMCYEYTTLLASCQDLADKWKCSKELIYGILKRNNTNTRGCGATDRTKEEIKLNKQKLYGTCVCKMDDSRNVIEEYFSVREAARQNGVYETAIRNAINGKSVKSAGYHWMLKRDIDNPEKLKVAYRHKEKTGKKPTQQSQNVHAAV